MSLQWRYSKRCLVCNCDLQRGKRRCKGLCGTCYDRKRKEEFGDQYKVNRRSKSPKKDWDQPAYMGLTPASTDWARLAAFIDGEGTIGLNPRRTKDSPIFCARVQITNTDPRLPVWLYDNFGFAVTIGNRKSDRWKDCYWSSAHGYRACWVLRNCLPWLLLKKEQAEIVLKHQTTIGFVAFDRGPGMTTPDNVIQFRMELKNRLHDLNHRGPNKLGSSNTLGSSDQEAS